ncbi:MAG: tetratricopeptide repeat protein [Armatimonadota bacterium]|nr:tetratricopeptide repeat protein [Armatimonadota bacterium]
MPRRPSLEDLVLGPKPGPGPDCPDELVLFHAASGLLSSEEQQAFERHLHTCLCCRDRELEARKLLYFEQHGVPYTVDPHTGRFRKAPRVTLSLAVLSPASLLRRLRNLFPGRLAVALASLLVVVLTWSALSPALARSPVVLTAAKQVLLVRWLLPAPVREYLEANLLLDRMGRLPAGRGEWKVLAQKAEQHLRRATRMDPGYADAHVLLGDLYLAHYASDPSPPTSRRYLDLAEAAYRRALAHSAGYIPARYGLAEVYATKGEFRRELEQYDAILRQDPDEGDARLFRGWVYMETGDHARAADEFQTLLRKDPTDWEAAWSLGLARVFQGKRAEALQEVERLERLHPGRARLLRAIVQSFERR